MDDDLEITKILGIYLTNEGYTVFSAHNADEAISSLNKNTIHLVVLDIMLPGMDGYQLCCKIREISNIPILMLSAKDKDLDKIIGLTTGADDYLTKPFNPLELVARVKSQLRRYIYLNHPKNIDPQHLDNILHIGMLKIDTIKCMVTNMGNPVELTPKEYGILVLLACNKGKVFSSEEIFREIWKEKYFTANNTIMVHIWNLREKIEENPKKPQIIKTVWGMGYKIED